MKKIITNKQFCFVAVVAVFAATLFFTCEDPSNEYFALNPDRLGGSYTYYCTGESCAPRSYNYAPPPLGCYTTRQQCENFLTPPQTAPATPTGVFARAVSSTSISVNWNAVNGAEGYNIYFSNDLNDLYSQAAGNLNSPPYTFSDLTPSTTYYFHVEAYNTYGISNMSVMASAATFPESGGNYTFYCPDQCVEQTGSEMPQGCYVSWEYCDIASRNHAYCCWVNDDALNGLCGVIHPQNIPPAPRNDEECSIDYYGLPSNTDLTGQMNVQWCEWTIPEHVCHPLTNPDRPNEDQPGMTMWQVCNAYGTIHNTRETCLTSVSGNHPYCCWDDADNPTYWTCGIIYSEWNIKNDADCINEYGLPSNNDRTGQASGVQWCRWSEYVDGGATIPANCAPITNPNKPDNQNPNITLLDACVLHGTVFDTRGECMSSLTDEWCRWNGYVNSCAIVSDGANRQSCLINSAARQVFSSENACRAWGAGLDFVSCFWGANVWNNNIAACWDMINTPDVCSADGEIIYNGCSSLCNQCQQAGGNLDCEEYVPFSNAGGGCRVVGGPAEGQFPH